MSTESSSTRHRQRWILTSMSLSCRSPRISWRGWKKIRITLAPAVVPASYRQNRSRWKVRFYCIPIISAAVLYCVLLLWCNMLCVGCIQSHYQNKFTEQQREETRMHSIAFYLMPLQRIWVTKTRYAIYLNNYVEVVIVLWCFVCISLFDAVCLCMVLYYCSVDYISFI